MERGTLLIVEVVTETDKLSHINFKDSLISIRDSWNILEFCPKDKGFVDEASTTSGG